MVHSISPKTAIYYWYNFHSSNLCFLLHSWQWPLSCLFVTSLYGEEKWRTSTLQVLFSSFLEVGFTCCCCRQQAVSILLKRAQGGAQNSKWTNFWHLCYLRHEAGQAPLFNQFFCVIPFSVDIQAKKRLFTVYCCYVPLRKCFFIFHQ